MTLDVEQMDTSVMELSQNAMWHFSKLCTVLMIISSTSVYFVGAVPLLVGLYCWFAYYYLSTSRQLKRLDSISRSPIYSSFSESLSGASTIRAFSSQQDFTFKNYEKIDRNHGAFFYLSAVSQWFALRVKCLSALVIFGAACGAVYGGLDSGWAALLLTFSLQFTLSLEFAVKDFSEVEMGMNAIERIHEYTLIDQEEENQEVANVRPDWPEKGRIELENLSVKYSKELPDALKNLSLVVEGGGQKIAICGRYSL